MSKLKQMIDAGIPVVESESNEETGAYTFTAMTDEQRETLNVILGGWDVIRSQRNQKIEAVRWMLDEGVPIKLTKRLDVLEYIQALRDIPQTFADPMDVVWPQEPKYEAS